MEYIASISYGKDSLAMLEVIKQHNMPLDRIVHAEAYATKDISCDLPSVVEFKRKADKIILERYGIAVEHILAPKTFEELFYQIPQHRNWTYKQRKENSSKYQGQIRGFPMIKGHWCNKALKVNVLREFNNANTIQYIGIACDEPERFSDLNERIHSPLVEHKVTEAECREICERLDLLAPHYSMSSRSGCWFCPFQPIDQLRLLRKLHPDLWELLLKWDSDSPVPFRHSGRTPKTVKDFDLRFELEDKKVVPENGFKWSMVEDYMGG